MRSVMKSKSVAIHVSSGLLVVVHVGFNVPAALEELIHPELEQSSGVASVA